MTQLSFWSSAEKRQFDSPPVFTKQQRPAYFLITDDIRRTLSAMRSPANKICFLLQLGYFRYSGKFFTPACFRKRDVNYLKTQFEVGDDEVDFTTFPSARLKQQRTRILQIMGWIVFDETKIAKHVLLQAQQQNRPEQVFADVVAFCWKHRIEIPSHHQLTTTITDSFNIVENRWLLRLANTLDPQTCHVLDELLESTEKLPSLLSKTNHSTKRSSIQNSAEQCTMVSEYVEQFEPCYAKLKLNEKAIEHYAIWVQKATITQLRQFPDPYKRYLYLLCFLQYQYCQRQDMLMDLLLKLILNAINTAGQKGDRRDLDNRQEQNTAIRSINEDRKSQRQLLHEITRIVRITDEEQSPAERMTRLQQLLDDYEALNDDEHQQVLQRSEQLIDRQTDRHYAYEMLEARSLALQKRANPILKVLVFDTNTSQQPLMDAVLHFQRTNGQIGSTPSLAFLNETEQALFDEAPRISLYKILLYRQILRAARGGRLNLKHSCRYRALQDYLIPQERWMAEKDRLLELAGLTHFADGKAQLADLKTALDETWEQVNRRYQQGENEFLTLDDNAQVKVRTPATQYSEEGTIGSVLSGSGIVPVLDILRQINQDYPFTNCLTHLSPKHHKLKPSVQTLLAGLIGLGCNIGIDKLSRISVGLNESTLKNTVTWCFSLKNLQAANAVIVAAIDKLALSNAFKARPGERHTGSDGRKVGVATDSLHAGHSFKYFGKDKGVSLYTFVDERHALFYSTVISPSEREAAYVIDGLMHNEVVKSDIHSTDTHGYTEAIFAATHLIDTAFAPRIKRLHRQKLYSFSGKATHERRGDAILPSRTIDHALILRHWDDILRFMATIKLRHSSASQLFKRLSSYASDHPLYQALKEFGRLIKSQYILTWYDDVELRQRIEKQLNKVELSNRFSKAVFFANSQQFQQGDLEQQQIATACTALIQNAIVLWNALYLSQQLLDTTDEQERRELLSAITEGSLLSWQHVNLQGEYDFRPDAANEDRFDLVKILQFRLPETE